jgi:RNA polymerase sigma factor (sigma-70 family)
MDRRPFEGDFVLVLESARHGDGAAFEALWRWLAPSVTAYFRHHGARDADDLASETFLRVFRDLGRFEGGERAFRSWVFVIAHHRWIDDRRRSARRPVESFDGVSSERIVDDASAERLALDAIDADRLRAWIGELVPDQREVLLLRLFGDLTIEQIADATARSIGSVKALQRRGLANLARRVEAPREFLPPPVPLPPDPTVTPVP